MRFMNFFGGYQPKCNKKMNVPYSGSKVKRYIDEDYVKVVEKNMKRLLEENNALQKENEQLKAVNEELKADKIIAERKEKDARAIYKNIAIQLEEKNEEIKTLKYIIEKDYGLIIKLSGVPVSEYNQKIKSEAIKEYDKQLWTECNKIMSEFTLSWLKGIREQVLKKMVGDDNARGFIQRKKKRF